MVKRSFRLALYAARTSRGKNVRDQQRPETEVHRESLSAGNTRQREYGADNRGLGIRDCTSANDRCWAQQGGNRSPLRPGDRLSQAPSSTVKRHAGEASASRCDPGPVSSLKGPVGMPLPSSLRDSHSNPEANGSKKQPRDSLKAEAGPSDSKPSGPRDSHSAAPMQL